MALTAEEKQEYADDGMTEEEINSLEELSNDEKDPGAGGEEFKTEDFNKSDAVITNPNDPDPVDDSTENKDAGDTDSPDKQDEEQDEKKVEKEEKEEPVASQKPLLDATLPEDWAEQVKAVDEERKALHIKFEDGDLETAKYQSELDALNDRRAELRQVKADVESAEKFNEAEAKRSWEGTVSSFLASNPKFKTSKTLHDSLNQAVMELAGTEEGQLLNGIQILTKAKESVEADLIQAGLMADPKKEIEKDEKKPAKTELPPNIGKLPSSAATEADDGNPFKKLDSLEGEEYEDALASLSDKNRSLYLAN